jgi:hypothetical protein
MLQDIQSGENTHTQDQVITSHNLSTTNTIVRTTLRLIPLLSISFQFLEFHSESLQVLQNILWKSDFKKCRLW